MVHHETCGSERSIQADGSLTPLSNHRFLPRQFVKYRPFDMRLIDTQSDPLRVVEFLEADIPPYVILSHCWGSEEVSLSDLATRYDDAKEKKGFAKLVSSVRQANRDGYGYVWIDTCW